ncbi:IclR family transcriptional regulator [Mycobacterium sp. DL440]|uniref:IclR family transcriptional regulator n=1 Tax=Mycobacterium sp. DL440 TaxID=2675523 RepID=UPI00141E5A97|nr:IclR family transcriptional regulator [Mycobacterium sp. DL440]
MPSSEPTSKQQPLLVLGKIVEILDAFSFSRPLMTLGEIQHTTGLPMSTVQRLVGNMTSRGLLDRFGDRFGIGARVAFWAATATKHLDVLAVVQPVLRRLRDQTGETAAFFRREREFRVCVALAETHHALRREMYVGKIAPLTAGSAGRVLLAYEPEIAENAIAGPIEAVTESTVTDPAELRARITQARADGYAITVGERDSAGSGLSAPVFGPSSEILGAVTISGPTLRLPRERCAEWVDLLVTCCEQITRTLGGRPPR